MLDEEQILAEMIRQFNERKITLTKIASHLDLPSSRVTEIKNGRRRIQASEMRKLAEILEMSSSSHVDMVSEQERRIPMDSKAALGAKKIDQRNTLGAKLRRLIMQSGRSYREVAKLAGYKGSSSVQRYFDDDYDAPALPFSVAVKLAEGFRGSKVAASDIMALAGGVPLSEATTINLPDDLQHVRRDLPVYATALGSVLDCEEGAVEQTYLDQGEVISYCVRPHALTRRNDVYGAYIQGSSMAPRFQEGEVAFVEEKRPPQLGDDVVVFVAQPDDLGERVSVCLIKRLVRRSSSQIELEQYNPPLTFKIDTNMVQRVHRIIPWGEILT